MKNLLIILKEKNQHVVIKSDLSEKFEGQKFNGPMDLINYLNSQYGITGWEMKNV